MDRSPTSPDSEIDALRRAYTALNRGDVDGFMASFAPDVERIEFGPGATYRGIEALRAHFVKARAMWAEGACEPERFEVVPNAEGTRIIAFVHVRVRLAHETQWREARIADGFAFRAGKVTAFRSFADEAGARAWAEGSNGAVGT